MWRTIGVVALGVAFAAVAGASGPAVLDDLADRPDRVASRTGARTQTRAIPAPVLLRPDGEMDLPALKEKAGLSNKKWDQATKSLSKKGLFEVEKTGERLLARAKG